MAKKFYLHSPVLESWMTHPWIDPATDKRRTYYNICIIKYFLDIISQNNDFKDKLKSLFASFPEIDLNAMGFNANWETEPLWTLPMK